MQWCISNSFIYICFFVFHLVVASLNWKPHPNSSVQEQANDSLNNILHKISYAGVWILQMTFGKQSAIAEQKRGQPKVQIALAIASSTSTNVHLASDNIKRHRNNRMVLLLVKNCWTKFEYIISHDMHFTDRHWALVSVLANPASSDPKHAGGQNATLVADAAHVLHFLNFSKLFSNHGGSDG